MMTKVLSSFLLISIVITIFASTQASSPLIGDSSRPEDGQRSLVIVFDTTGSMSDELEQVRKQAMEIVEYVANQPRNPFYNYIFVEFNDPSK
jgi:hypothetical protein